ncbi:MAG: glutamine--fructose-6-phosphate transaminase (isomerizing) [Ruminococcaceae bacterium]|jgi:glucosamine--fructose-6-phosphate aminotransferase (isomerizing)|nr:glutamine--fructose-6-phosphate transaminase (isomerizing) [Oscillospiraceae bacterium]
MCGIVGFVGAEQAAPILLDGLRRLEYRGYDSAGIAVCGGGELQIKKSRGRLAILSELTHDGTDLSGTLGIGHTRWATHGAPNDVNAHPHLSRSGRIAVVHNGIIENYAELKEQLLNKGYTFRSETDTEVVAQLLDYYYDGCGDFFEAVTCLLNALEGAYALGIVCADYPDRLYAARKDAPLLLGYGEGASYLASDVTALIRYTRDIVYMDDGELAILSDRGVRIYDRQMRPIEKEHHHIDWEIDAAEKGGYAHFMLKEIMEQPRAVREATAARIQGGRVVLSDLTMTPEQIRAIGKIYIVACGSSYHVGMVGKYNLERMLRRTVEVCLASEFRYSDPIVGEGDLVIVISQSGETLDTMAALREAKKRGARILSIVNVVGSSIARESDDVLYTWAGPEIAVATTKAYSTQMAVLNLLGVYFGDIMGTVDYETYTDMVRGILALPEQMERVLEQGAAIHELAKRCAHHEDVFFIGRNLDYALSLEGSLKLKEISYIHSEAYASGELKHGTISLVEDGTLVIALATYGPLFDKAMSNVEEVQARGAQVLALTTGDRADAMAEQVDMVLSVPETEPMLLPQLGVVPLQMFAYYIALERGCDIDKPRNLAKSVTVE